MPNDHRKNRTSVAGPAPKHDASTLDLAPNFEILPTIEAASEALPLMIHAVGFQRRLEATIAVLRGRHESLEPVREDQIHGRLVGADIGQVRSSRAQLSIEIVGSIG